MGLLLGLRLRGCHLYIFELDGGFGDVGDGLGRGFVVLLGLLEEVVEHFGHIVLGVLLAVVSEVDARATVEELEAIEGGVEGADHLAGRPVVEVHLQVLVNASPHGQPGCEGVDDLGLLVVVVKQLDGHHQPVVDLVAGRLHQGRLDLEDDHLAKLHVDCRLEEDGLRGVVGFVQVVGVVGLGGLPFDDVEGTSLEGQVREGVREAQAVREPPGGDAGQVADEFEVDSHLHVADDHAMALDVYRMTSRNKVLFNLNSNLPCKIRLVALHPGKEWLALITTTNTFALWNYRHKVLVKSFSCNTLDDSKQVDIRQMVFFDRLSLPYPPKAPTASTLIFAGHSRLYLYDYLSDNIKVVNEKELENRIRKVCVYSESKLCVSLSDGSFRVFDRDAYSKNAMTMKTIRGFHSKPITWITAYCQNANEMPRVITVSAQDGLMACWNVDTLLHAPQVPDPAAPSFKFTRQGAGKAHGGEELLSVQYDPTSYRLVTLSEAHITLWSTMTGMELRRFRNPSHQRETIICNHFSFGAGCLMVHAGRTGVGLVRGEGELEESVVDIRSYVGEGDCQISWLGNRPWQPSEVFICTQANLFVIEVNKFYRPGYGFHPSFQTRMSTLNLVSKGQIRADVTSSQVAALPFEAELLFNTFFLSFENGWVCFHLVELQFENMLFEQRKYKKHQVAESSLLSRPTSTQTLVEVRYDGKEFLLFNKDLLYYEVYAIPHDLLGLSDTPTLECHSNLQVVSSGHARDIVWHQYKEQFAVVRGFDKQGRPVEYVTEKKGFFGKEKVARLSAEVAAWRTCVFEKASSGAYQCVHQSEPVKSRLSRVCSFGAMFGCSCDQGGSEVVSFLNDERATGREVEGAPLWPERVFLSYCETYQVWAYDGYFVLYRADENSQLSYCRSVQETVLEGLFWERFFFFATPSSLFFMQVTTDDLTLVRLADQQPPLPSASFGLEHDDLEEGVGLMPQGQLQLLTVVNFHLMMLSHSGQVLLVGLRDFPFVEFCLEAVLGNTERLGALYEASGPHLRQSMRETLKAYKLMIPAAT